MEPFHLTLLVSIIFCSLVAGLLFGFAIVVMPGIANLSDKEYLLAFKYMDGVIQNNQPLFVFVWAGSILSVILTLVLGILNLDDEKLYLLIGAASVYLIGVQLPTFRFNIPLNNELQNLDIEDLEETQAKTSRTKFETSWNRWNKIRTINGIVAVSMFLLLLYFL